MHCWSGGGGGWVITDWRRRRRRDAAGRVLVDHGGGDGGRVGGRRRRRGTAVLDEAVIAQFTCAVSRAPGKCKFFAEFFKQVAWRRWARYSARVRMSLTDSSTTSVYPCLCRLFWRKYLTNRLLSQTQVELLFYGKNSGSIVHNILNKIHILAKTFVFHNKKVIRMTPYFEKLLKTFLLQVTLFTLVSYSNFDETI